MAGEDGKLLKQAKAGDEAAFNALYLRHRTPVFRFAWRLTGSLETAEDVVQECFVALLDGAAFDARQASLRTYLFGVARHLAMKHVRVGQRESEAMPEALSPWDTLNGLLGRERAAAVARAVATLPPFQKEALILFEYEELSLEEIAEITGVEVGAVKARLHRARESLRRQLAPLFAPCSQRSSR